VAATLTDSGRSGSPEDIAKAVVFLLGSDAALATEAAIMVDGGYTGADFLMKKDAQSLG
jgi:NAD(P)-dependent dehydrogenase (short-subunit alcohol dehydrogenase family)